jgi:hypothetical protein
LLEILEDPGVSFFFFLSFSFYLHVVVDDDDMLNECTALQSNDEMMK